MSDEIEFQPWPSIARLNRDIVITEKIDGTNAAVVISETPVASCPRNALCGIVDGVHYFIGAQSRKRLITPESDNFGFAAWVKANAEGLVRALGPGRHFGEWWGSGIQRGYGLEKGDKRFSLFDTHRYGGLVLESGVGELYVVPELYRGPFSQAAIVDALDDLHKYGSLASDGYLKPEGIVIFHTAARTMFKVTLENDDQPKSLVR